MTILCTSTSCILFYQRYFTTYKFLCVWLKMLATSATFLRNFNIKILHKSHITPLYLWLVKNSAYNPPIVQITPYGVRIKKIIFLVQKVTMTSFLLCIFWKADVVWKTQSLKPILLIDENCACVWIGKCKNDNFGVACVISFVEFLLGYSLRGFIFEISKLLFIRDRYFDFRTLNFDVVNFTDTRTSRWCIHKFGS